MINDEKRKELKDELPRGAITRISENTGLSKAYVSLCLSGKYWNADVFTEAIRIRDDQRKQRKEVESKI